MCLYPCSVFMVFRVTDPFFGDPGTVIRDPILSTFNVSLSNGAT